MWMMGRDSASSNLSPSRSTLRVRTGGRSRRGDQVLAGAMVKKLEGVDDEGP
jgi:hypothetical protein